MKIYKSEIKKIIEEVLNEEQEYCKCASSVRNFPTRKSLDNPRIRVCSKCGLPRQKKKKYSSGGEDWKDMADLELSTDY